ncbi:MAG: hypothetical protein QOC70_1539 [Verrucomicrobiota bacterium]
MARKARVESPGAVYHLDAHKICRDSKTDPLSFSYSEELLHAKDGRWEAIRIKVFGDPHNRHDQIHRESDKILERFRQETGDRYLEHVSPP